MYFGSVNFFVNLLLISELSIFYEIKLKSRIILILILFMLILFFKVNVVLSNVLLSLWYVRIMERGRGM